jgi:hypothetical protein
LKFDQLYRINEWIANDILLVSKIFLGYIEALCSKEFESSHASQILTNTSSDFGSVSHELCTSL